jgi:hypothetical protein
MSNELDRGADNPHRNVPNCHETRKGGQGPIWAVAPLMMMSNEHNLSES